MLTPATSAMRFVVSASSPSRARSFTHASSTAPAVRRARACVGLRRSGRCRSCVLTARIRARRARLPRRRAVSMDWTGPGRELTTRGAALSFCAMKKTNYVITGATGTVGGAVVERLLERGERVRVLVRDAAAARRRFGDRVEIAVADLADAATLPPGLAGGDALLLLNGGPDLAARDAAVAQAARAAGIGFVLKLSSKDAAEEVGTGPWHARGEAAIRASGIPFTFLRPSGFMSNALGWAAAIRADGVVRLPT